MRRNKKKINKTYIIASLVIVALLSISVGFSALSTSLSINGTASFEPVGLIRVMSISQDSLTNVTGLSESITPDSIKTTMDFNNINGTATYNVVIRNLGQIDYKFTGIDEVLFSNNQIEYELVDLAVNDVIEAGDELAFKVVFKYKDGIQEPLVERLNSELKFLFEEYEDTTFREVFSHVGACTFNGPNQNITGQDCPEYADEGFIDTGVALYSEENWDKDYEIGFTIDSYDYSRQVQQAVFVNSKYENESIGYPGIVFRAKTNSRDMEITETLKGTKASGNITNPSIPLQVRIFRISGIIYYSLNGAPMVQLQNTNNLKQTFTTTTWFGATPDINGNPIRNLAGTMSNMYLKLGHYNPTYYTVTFNANGGNVSESTRDIIENNQVGTLPVPTYTGYNFEGWYTDTNYTTQVSASTIVTGDVTYYAKWSDNAVAELNGVHYLTFAEAISHIPTDGTTATIKLLANVSASNVVIPAGANVIFDFGDYTLSNDTSKPASPVIENSGTLSIISGTYTTAGTSAVINNNTGGNLTISNATISATGTKQALYNDSGTCTISGNTTLSATSNMRATVHNLNNGNLTITSANITATRYDAIKNDSGTLVIGVNDGTVDTNSVIVRSSNNGVTSSVNYSLYDGTMMGVKNAVNNTSKITNIESGYSLQTGTEVVNGLTYKTLYLGTN